MTRAWGVTTLRILDTLEQIGPMTRSEMCRHLNLTREEGSAIFSRLSRPTLRPVGQKRIYIQAWRYDDEGGRHYPRAVYALGDLPDKPKPRVDRKAVRRRSRQRVKTRRLVNVLLIGATRKQQKAFIERLRGTK